MNLITEQQTMQNIITCNFYKNQKKHYNNKLFLEENTIYFENINNPENLMIVAHPDDEIIFGGNELFNGEKYLVIYCTNDFKRINIIKKISHDKKFNAIIYCHVDSVNKNMLFSIKLYEDIKFIIKENNFKKIITHNSDGEYGHIQHILVHKMISNILCDINYNGIFMIFHDNKENDINAYNIKYNIMNKYYNLICDNYVKYYNLICDNYVKYYNYDCVAIQPIKYNLCDLLFY
jgi:hypothetical protein